MNFNIGIHEDDVEDLVAMRRVLAGYRVVSGMRQRAAGQKAGLADTMVSAVERGENSAMRLQVLAKYASVFNLAVYVSFDDLDGIDDETPELSSLRALADSKPFNGTYLEALAVAFLRHARESLEVPLDMMAARLGMRPGVLEAYERDGVDPHLLWMFRYARELGGRMRLSIRPV